MINEEKFIQTLDIIHFKTLLESIQDYFLIFHYLFFLLIRLTHHHYTNTRNIISKIESCWLCRISKYVLLNSKTISILHCFLLVRNFKTHVYLF